MTLFQKSVPTCRWFGTKRAFVGLFLVGFAPEPSQALTIVSDRKPQAVLVLSTQPTELEIRAAAEIRDYVKRISGAELATVSVTEDPNGRVPIRIGSAAGDELLGDVRARKDDPASFVLKVGPDGASIRGLSDQGTLFGAYELLEQLGVRWFMPSQLGTVVPQFPTLELAPQTNIQVPSFAARHMNEARNNKDWGLRLRTGGAYFPSAHGIPLGGKAATVFQSNPEYFALVDGKRVIRQVCISNPQVLQRTIEATRDYFRKKPNSPWLGMGPEDGSGFCECDNCRVLNSGAFDVFSNDPVVTDRYIWFFNQVLAGITEEFPDKKIGFYIYHSYQEPPTKVKADPRIVGALAPIALCRIHGPGNPLCPEASYYQHLITGWSKTLSEVYDRGYWFNLADPGFPFIMVHRMRVQIPLAHEQGLTGWRVETNVAWASQNPSLYIAAKLMWNHAADVDVLLADFHEKFYGPAAEPMAAYTALLDAALRDADHHTGGATDMPRFYPPELRSKARNLLERAATLAEGKGVYADRVNLTRKSFDYLEAFIAMLDDRNRGDFVSAKAVLDRLRTVQDDLITGYEIPLLNKQYTPSYLKRFWSQATEQGYARVTGGNQPVAVLADEWQFLQDPKGLGETLGWHKGAEVGGNWQTVRTTSASWSDQGLRYYKGLAWYRQTVDVPATFTGKRLFLWVGGVDEKAKVWVNGQPIGISFDASFVPFELDVTDAIRAGESNTVTVLVNNGRVDELGTGGITAAVLLYAPAADKGAVLENARELGRTFP